VSGLFRIGELSRRSGVTPELLRAWERRYGLLQPERSSGGLRLYTESDLERVRTMQRHLASGLAAAEAAALAGASSDVDESAAGVFAAQRDLGDALASFDEARAQSILDSLAATTTLDGVLSQVVLPYLHELGDRWERGEVSVAQEHFASGVIRGRLLALARGWGRGIGPRAVLACAPGEQHDLALIAFGLALRSRGWRIVYLGQDTPLASVADAAHAAEPEFVIIAAVDAKRLRSHRDELRTLATKQTVFLAGAAVAKIDADDFGVRLLRDDPVAAADYLTSIVS
jgi:MerR family transcriptional regulator, light-induced transcriptional regulator